LTVFLEDSKAKESAMKENFCLSKHKNGYYYIYYFDSNNKRKSVSTTKKYKSEALAALNELRPSIQAQQHTTPITLTEYRWEFLKASESYHSWKTTKDYRSTFNELEKYFGNLQLCQFTQKGIEEFIQKKIRDKSIYTGRRHLINIKALFNRAIGFNYIASNPATAIKRIRTPERLPSFFSKGEFQMLQAAIDDADYRDVIDFAVNTGLRQMEILSLQRGQFNEAGRLVILDNQNHTTKSKRVRTIPLNTRAYEILLSRKGDLLFTKNGIQVSPDHLQDQFKKYIKKTGITRKITFHSLRHTFASWLVQAGVSIYEVSKLLGHSDIKTTQIYAHLRGDDLRRSVELLE